MKHIYIIMYSSIIMHCIGMNAQLRSGYFMDNNITRNDINPAMHSDSSYWSLPILGNTHAEIQSSIGLKSILFDNGKGGLTTFMTDGTISKPDLMEAVGNGVKTNADATVTLINIGNALNAQRFQTFSASIKTKGHLFLNSDLFDMMKDIENRNYILGNSSIDIKTMLELSYGESWKLDERLTVGAKFKLLLGLLNANIKMSQIHADISTSNSWIANGRAVANMSGITFSKELKQYDSYSGEYEQVSNFKLNDFGIHGIGTAIDLGIIYKLDPKTTVSAAITDLGFISWNSRKAENNGDYFLFEGFQNTSYHKPDGNSIGSQWDAIHDDLMDMMHLKDGGRHTFTQMPGATITAGMEYDMRDYARVVIGTLLTHRQQGDYSWTEIRVSGVTTPFKETPLDISISPAFSTFGVSLGLMATYKPSARTTIFLGSDHIFTKVNPQLIPNDLNGGLCFGMSLQM